MHKIDTQNTSKGTQSCIRKVRPLARGPAVCDPLGTLSRISCRPPTYVPSVSILPFPVFTLSEPKYKFMELKFHSTDRDHNF